MLTKGEGGVAFDRVILALIELDDRDPSIRPGRVVSIAHEGWEDTVSEHRQPLALRLVVDDRRPHRDPTEGDVRMRSKVVVPGLGVSRFRHSMRRS